MLVVPNSLYVSLHRVTIANVSFTEYVLLTKVPEQKSSTNGKNESYFHYVMQKCIVLHLHDTINAGHSE